MKLLANFLIAFVIVSLSQIAVADTASTVKEKFTVTVSPSVKKQIQKLSSDERKKLEDAIRTGNKFIPHHFDLTAYARNDEQEEKIWLKNIRPLVNRDSVDWYNPGGVFADGAPELEINGSKVIFEVVCPVPELISANAVDDHFELKYRTKIIGMWKSNSIEHPIQGDILLDEKEEFDEVLINLDKSYRVSQVASKYAALPSLPQKGIDSFASDIKWLEWGLNQSHYSADEKSRSKAKIPHYKHVIELIKNEEAAACKGTSSNYK